MTCRELTDFILDYLSGELPEPVLAEFRGHLSRCPNCVNYLQNYEDAVRAGRAAFSSANDEPPEDLPEELVQAVLAARARSSGPRA